MSSPTQIILALDFPTQTQAFHALDKLEGAISQVKVGLELFFAEGIELLKALDKRHCHIFLDLKLHDIPHTVSKAITALKGLPINFLSVHASGGARMLQAARATAEKTLPHTRILAVTLLTSLDTPQLRQLHVPHTAREHTLHLARLALENDIKGLICSPLDLAALRKQLGDTITLASPGIRAENGTKHDQRRTLSATQAQRAGANYLIIGRPITQASCPPTALQQLKAELKNSL